jgi:hypothetical protein
MHELISFAMVGGPLLAGLVIGSWWGARRFWGKLISERKLGQQAAEQLALRHGLKIELYDLGGG